MKWGKSNQLIVAILAILAVSCSVSPLRAQDGPADKDRVEFKGFSQPAERMIERLFHTLRSMRSYSDEGVIQMVTGPTGTDDQPASFAYVKPRRFHVRGPQHDVYCDGKELTVYSRQVNRYIVTPVQKDVGRQIERYAEFMLKMSVAELVLGEQPKKEFADDFHNLEVADREDIDGQQCVKLVGEYGGTMMGVIEEPVPVILWLRESDSMIRRLEIDLFEAIKAKFAGEQTDEEGETVAAPLPFKEYRIVYDVRNIRVNEPPSASTFTFEPPSGAKKVDAFYSRWQHTGDTVAQFELSGKPAPAFEMSTVDGKSVSLESLKDKVVVLCFLPNWQGKMPGMDTLDEVRKAYADKGAEVFCVVNGRGDTLQSQIDDEGLSLVVLSDELGSVAGDYFKDDFASGAVLIGKDGIVQGIYRGFHTKATAKALQSDLGKLVEGQTLPGGKPMTPEQIEEAGAQRESTYRYGGDSVEEIDADALREAWSVRAEENMSFFGGGRVPPDAKGTMWIRDKDRVLGISPKGEKVGEISLPKRTRGQFVQDSYVVGQIGGHTGVVYMAAIPGEPSEENPDWSPPKGATLTAADETGRELWTMEIEAGGQMLPQLLVLADLDGRAGDELVFLHQGALWVVNERGDVVARKTITGWGLWFQAEDLDRDRRAEIYLRTQQRLYRFDYVSR
jgi:peroxiredoxin/outer membrane lipoprotein-sorting protein